MFEQSPGAWLLISAPGQRLVFSKFTCQVFSSTSWLETKFLRSPW